MCTKENSRHDKYPNNSFCHINTWNAISTKRRQYYTTSSLPENH